MKRWINAALLAVVSTFAHAASEVAPRVEHVPFDKGADSVKFNQSIKGPLKAQYRVNARAGQILTVDLKPSNASAYFNITVKGADAALFNGSIMGNHFMGPLPSMANTRFRCTSCATLHGATRSPLTAFH